MVKSLLKKATLVCLLCLLFVTKGNAVTADWYCDPHNGTYSVMDLSSFRTTWLTNGLTMDVLLSNNPYFLVMPRNLAAGESLTAHFKARCVGNAVNAYQISAFAKDAQNYVLSSSVISCKTNDWTADYAFPVAEETKCIDFHYLKNGNTKAKQVMCWIPMPVHLDVNDFNFPDSVEVDEAIDLYIPMNTFFLEEGAPSINLVKTNNPANSNDFTIIRGSVTPLNRCGHNRWCDHDQRRYFADTRLACNMFVVRFNPKTAGEQECEFVVSNGSQSKTIRVKAKAFRRYVKYIAVGEGAVQLYVNHSRVPAFVPEGSHVGYYEFKKGDHLRFVAVPGSCSHFVNWSTNPFHHFPVFDMVGVHTFAIHANFAPNKPKLHIVSNNPCHGRVFYDKCEKHIYCGAMITFTAAPAPGYQFKGWTTCQDTNTIISTDLVYTTEITGDLCLIAQFEEEVPYNGFRFICETSNGVDITYSNPSVSTGIPDAALVYSYDAKNWETYVIGTAVHLDNKGDVVYFRADSVNRKGVRGLFSIHSTPEESLVPSFAASDTVSVAGDINYLLANDGVVDELPQYAFASMLTANKILYADELILPADSVSKFAYHSMFRSCYTLEKAPVLPATKLSGQCYSFMFMNDTALTVAPELPASEIPVQAYEGMFRGTSITAAPELQATVLSENCYRMMFWDCFYLTDVQDTLPALDLAPNCYETMFSCCTSLAKAPELPSTTLANGCYKKMFRGCTALETAPVLPATSIADLNKPYWSLFEGCSSLNRIEVGLSEFSNKGAGTPDWTKGVAEDGTFICPNMPEANQKRNNAAQNIYRYIPTNWNVNPQQIQAPRKSEVEYIAVAEDMNIIVKGAQDATVSVYDAAGRLVSTIENPSDFETISIAVPGVYVVKVEGQEATRVIVK